MLLCRAEVPDSLSRDLGGQTSRRPATVPPPAPGAIFTGTVGSHTTHLGSSRGRAGTRRPKVVQPNPTLLRLRLAWLPRSLLGPCLVPPVKTEMEAELDTTLCGPGLSSPRDSNPFSSPLHSRERFPLSSLRSHGEVMGLQMGKEGREEAAPDAQTETEKDRQTETERQRHREQWGDVSI